MKRHGQRRLTVLGLGQGAPRWAARSVHVFQIVGMLDQLVGVGAGLVSHLWSSWVLIHPPPPTVRHLQSFEQYFGKEDERNAYNRRSLERVARTRQPLLSSFRGTLDYFLPVLRRSKLEGVLVSGTFRKELPTAAELIEEWSNLRGRTSDHFDAGLSRYARAALAIPVLGERGVRALGELLGILARAVADDPVNLQDLMRADYLRERVLGRTPHARQLKVSMMVDPVLGHRRPESYQKWHKRELGISAVPNMAIAVIPSNAGRSSSGGVVGALVAGRRFQQAAAELALRSENVLTAPLETYGAYILLHLAQQRSPTAQRLLAHDRAREIGRAVAEATGQSVTIGVGNYGGADSTLPEYARRAVIALELAVQQGKPLAAYDDVPGEWRSPSLEQAPVTHLGRLVEAVRARRLSEVATCGADYTRAVLVRCGGRTEVERAHFMNGVDALVTVLSKQRHLDERTLLELQGRLHATLDGAESSPALAAALRDAIELILSVQAAPEALELELKLSRAARYIEEHLREPLDVARVARQARLSKNYFSTRFRCSFGVGFSAYLTKARIEHAKKMLAGSDLLVSRVAEESGFATIPHFNRVFRRVVGKTPSEYRAAQRPTAGF
jgi:AraC-like DNA-binding protein